MDKKREKPETEKYLVPYELVQLLFDIDERDEDFCQMLLRSANVTVEKFLDRNLAERFYLERLQADNGVLKVREYPIVDIVSVTDCESGKTIQQAENIDDEYNYLIILPIECGNKYYDVNYMAGYDADTVRAPIVEAVTKLFIHKKQAFLEMQMQDKKATKKEIPTAIPDDIKELLIPYQRKRL